MAVVIAIDAGTSSVKVSALDESAKTVLSASLETTVTTDGMGKAEQDPTEVWNSVLWCLRSVCDGLGDRTVASVGITNQRESFLLVDSKTMEPLTPLILWLDRRSEKYCDGLKDQGYGPRVSELTGLAIDPYFSATKAKMALSDLREAGLDSKVTLLTVDSFIAHKLTKQPPLTDASNASRTLLFDTDKMRFSDELVDIFGLSEVALPEVKSSFESFQVIAQEFHPKLRGVEITGILGDQQASLLGQGCIRFGMAKNTYGTGSFILVNAGEIRPQPSHGLLVSVAWLMPDGKATYAIEGSIFACGSILRWMRDDLKIFNDYQEASLLAQSVNDSGGVVLVPAFEGLGSPHLTPSVRASITGISQGTSKAHIIRGAIEAMAFQTQDVISAINGLLENPIDNLRVDGGAAIMDTLCQFQADQLGIEVSRSASLESTTLGAAFASGLGSGFWSNMEELASLYESDRSFIPTKSKGGPRSRHDRWSIALEHAKRFSQHS